eukprot:TRINITY_DN1671_c0_g1_i1.p2 TRINITY_DN1671_c0_g1~~TRINITY_DN1671_c0_g1_i1.p2  ORF type:complete len:284 (-),score=125.49 TRINITY_DN1671_c0_g1_i1:17-868(-)
MATRPEHEAPPDLFYNEDEARKYAQNSRMIQIQTELAERCLELLNLPEPDVSNYLLDIGCGSGLSGDVISEHGHAWVGLDISMSMLNIARDREAEGDLYCGDMGDGFNYRAGCFDGAISVSALQWLCNSYTSRQVPKKRISRFFSSLYASLVKGARAVFQFYPENVQQLDMITSCAMAAGFSGGLVVDFPHSSKAKKTYLCLFAGSCGVLPKPLGDEAMDMQDDPTTVAYSDKKRRIERRSKKKKDAFKSKSWIFKKKESQRNKGEKVRKDSKYTGRKRSTPF